jgi:hypothetical protein
LFSIRCESRVLAEYELCAYKILFLERAFPEGLGLHVSFTPGFSPATSVDQRQLTVLTVFKFPEEPGSLMTRARKTVKTVMKFLPRQVTGLKPGVTERHLTAWDS